MDLIPQFFPDGLPVCFMPEAAQARSLPVMVSAVTFRSSESIDNDSMDSFPLTSDISRQLKSLETSISDVGAGSIPNEELPVRVSLSSSPSLDIENASRRAALMERLGDLLRINANLVGFCSYQSPSSN